MPGIGFAIMEDSNGQPFIALTVDSGLVNTQIWVADKATIVHNSAEIIRQLKAVTADLLAQPDKLIQVKGNLDGIHDKPGRQLPARSAGRPPLRKGSSRP